MATIRIQERGWAGHFVCADRCRFRRNTLLTLGSVRIVVSTVGLMASLRRTEPDGSPVFERVGCDRYFETMAFHADPADERYHDADVTQEVCIVGKTRIDELDADDKANDMHDAAVAEIKGRMLAGEWS